MVRDVLGIAVALIVLAGVSMAIVNGGNTALLFSSAANGFASTIRAATLQK